MAGKTSVSLELISLSRVPAAEILEYTKGYSAKHRDAVLVEYYLKTTFLEVCRDVHKIVKQPYKVVCRVDRFSGSVLVGTVAEFRPKRDGPIVSLKIKLNVDSEIAGNLSTTSDVVCTFQLETRGEIFNLTKFAPGHEHLALSALPFDLWENQSRLYDEGYGRMSRGAEVIRGYQRDIVSYRKTVARIIPGEILSFDWIKFSDRRLADIGLSKKRLSKHDWESYG
jgi:hypothetical protein